MGYVSSQKGRWLFQRFFIFTPSYLGEDDPHFDFVHIFSTGFGWKTTSQLLPVHLIIISEGGPLPWTLLCCFGIAGPLGLWRFLAAPPWALGGRFHWLVGWMFEWGLLDTWHENMILYIYICLQYFCLYIYIYIIYIYLYISTCSIYVYEYAVSMYMNMQYIYITDYIWYASGTQVAFWGYFIGLQRPRFLLISNHQKHWSSKASRVRKKKQRELHSCSGPHVVWNDA